MTREQMKARLKTLPPKSHAAVLLHAKLIKATNEELAAMRRVRVPAISRRIANV